MSAEQRTHRRLAERSTIFIETQAASDQHTQQDTIVICSSIEVSARGLRVGVDEAIEPGTILQLGVQLPELATPLYLVGEVRWNAPDLERDNGYVVGFELLESAGTDYEIWCSLLEEDASSAGEN